MPKEFYKFTKYAYVDLFMEEYLIPQLLERDNYTDIKEGLENSQYEIIVKNENGTYFRYTYDGETIEPYKEGILNRIMNYVNIMRKKILSGFDSITSRLTSIVEDIITSIISAVKTILNCLKNLF